MSEFFNTSTPKARKDYRCAWCGQTIPKGEKHTKEFGVWEGELQNWRMHDECFEDAAQSEEMQEGFLLYEHERPIKINYRLLQQSLPKLVRG